MWDYILFWIAKELAPLIILLCLILMFFFFVFCAHAWKEIRRKKN